MAHPAVPAIADRHVPNLVVQEDVKNLAGSVITSTD
jgi:hypothetical protein